MKVDMIRVLLVVCAVFLFYALCLPKALGQEEAVVLVHNVDTKTYGGGFIINPLSIITAYHIVEDAKQVKVHFKDGRQITMSVTEVDEEHDLALLQSVEMTKMEVTSVSISQKEVKSGDNVHTVHHTKGLQWSYARGYVMHPLREGIGKLRPFIQVDININKGASGSPLFNEDGEVVGVASFVYHDYACYIPINLACKKLIRCQSLLDKLWRNDASRQE